jgi:hypothetical protein
MVERVIFDVSRMRIMDTGKHSETARKELEIDHAG